jgi:hypothetical protein
MTLLACEFRNKRYTVGLIASLKSDVESRSDESDRLTAVGVSDNNNHPASRNLLQRNGANTVIEGNLTVSEGATILGGLSVVGESEIEVDNKSKITFKSAKGKRGANIAVFESDRITLSKQARLSAGLTVSNGLATFSEGLEVSGSSTISLPSDGSLTVRDSVDSIDIADFRSSGLSVFKPVVMSRGLTVSHRSGLTVTTSGSTPTKIAEIDLTGLTLSSGRLLVAGQSFLNGGVTIRGGLSISSGADGNLTVTGGAIAGATSISTASVAASGQVQAGSLTVGSFKVTDGAITGATSITAGFLTATGEVKGGSLTAIGKVTGVSLDVGNFKVSDAAAITGAESISTVTLTATGKVAGDSLDVGTAFKVSTAGAIIGATSITAGSLTSSGEVKGGSLTASGKVTGVSLDVGNFKVSDAAAITGAASISTVTLTATGKVAGDSLDVGTAFKVSTDGAITGASTMVLTDSLIVSKTVDSVEKGSLAVGPFKVTDGAITGATSITAGSLTSTGEVKGGSLTASGKVTGVSLDVGNFKVSDAAAITGAASITSTGPIAVGTGFTVDANGAIIKAAGITSGVFKVAGGEVTVAKRLDTTAPVNFLSVGDFKVTDSGAITGATTIDASGSITTTGGSLTVGALTVSNAGAIIGASTMTLYDSLTVLKTVDSVEKGSLTVGPFKLIDGAITGATSITANGIVKGESLSVGDMNSEVFTVDANGAIATESGITCYSIVIPEDSDYVNFFVGKDGALFTDAGITSYGTIVVDPYYRYDEMTGDWILDKGIYSTGTIVIEPLLSYVNGVGTKDAGITSTGRIDVTTGSTKDTNGAIKLNPSITADGIVKGGSLSVGDMNSEVFTVDADGSIATKAVITADGEVKGGSFAVGTVFTVDPNGAITTAAGITSTGPITVASGTNVGSGWGINDNALGARGDDSVLIADTTILNEQSNGKWHQLGPPDKSDSMIITFPLGSGLYHFYVTVDIPDGKVIDFKCGTNNMITVGSIFNKGVKKVSGSTRITGGLAIGDTVTVMCNKSNCYATLISTGVATDITEFP